MDWKQLPALLGALGVIVTGVTKFAGQASRLRSRIRHDQETLQKLDAGPTRVLLAQHIDATVRQLIRIESDRAKRTNDWVGVGLAIAFLGMALGLAVWTVKAEWVFALDLAAWFSVVVLALFGIVGLTESVHKRPESADQAKEQQNA